jgi:hypothetical protein
MATTDALKTLTDRLTDWAGDAIDARAVDALIQALALDDEAEEMLRKLVRQRRHEIAVEMEE